MSVSPARLSPLTRLRLRLTLWYAGVFTLILVGLGGGLFLAVRRQLSHQLDASLRSATAAVQQAARIREVERAQARGPVTDAVAELHIPDRALYLLDGSGRPITPPQAAEWVQAAARVAGRVGVADTQFQSPDVGAIRLHAERFTGGSGGTYVAAVAASGVELEDRYASLLEVFGAAALAGLVLVAGGGYILVRQSTAPVERSMEQMRRFVADAAHELRTPLTILRTRAEVALGEPRDGGRDTAVLQAIEREAERLGVVVGDLLTLARADAGERPRTSEVIYLDDLAADAIDGIRPVAEQRGVAVQLGDFEEARIKGDTTLVRRLLLILLDNAVKFTPAGGRVRLDVAADGAGASVVVSDTGAGIPAQALPRVFDRFFRADSTRRDADGAGLGLAIARWIADTHGGRIELQSTVGQGTRVAVLFPSAP
jgi:signal transduction histidine kinase